MNINVGDTSWMARKACVTSDVDPEAFFENGTSKAALERAAEAKDVCGRCLVKSACDEYAIANKIEFGIWGGRDENERAALIGAASRFPGRPNAPTVDERCGSYAGVGAHRKRDERYCDPCRDIRNEYESAWKRRSRAAKRQEMSA